MIADVEQLYRQHFTQADRHLLGTLRPEGGELGDVLEDPAIELALFGPAEPGAPLAATSPFLTFAVAVHRSAARMRTATYVEERAAPRQRVPVFGVAPLNDLLADPGRRLFLVELLASYTHVASGTTWQRTRRGWRRRRFSELDPVRLAGLLEAVEPSERAGVYRRLGDLALFLTGVFVDHGAVFEIGPAGAERLARLSGLRPGTGTPVPGPELLEALGSRWYSLALGAARATRTPVTGTLRAVEDIATRFVEARRVLNVVTDWYLFPLRPRWFGLG